MNETAFLRGLGVAKGLFMMFYLLREVCGCGCGDEEEEGSTAAEGFIVMVMFYLLEYRRPRERSWLEE
jgi:hypothetical protein